MVALGTAERMPGLLDLAAMWPVNSSGLVSGSACGVSSEGPRQGPGATEGGDRWPSESMSEDLVSASLFGYLLAQPSVKCWLCMRLGLRGARYTLAGMQVNGGQASKQTTE